MDNSSDSEGLPQASESQASSMPRPLIQSPTPRELLPHIPIGHPDSMMSRESVRRAVEEFQTRPSDIIVATFPKTGTTLITWICHLLRTNALPIEENDGTENSFETLYEVVPWHKYMVNCKASRELSNVPEYFYNCKFLVSSQQC